nr:uncharacterized protein LOC109183739 isoform X5 [Ipomoea trifida]
MPLILPITDDTGNRESRPCQLLLSDTHLGDSPRLLYIYKRWVSSIYAIRGDGFGFSKKKSKPTDSKLRLPRWQQQQHFRRPFSSSGDGSNDSKLRLIFRRPMVLFGDSCLGDDV